MKKLIASLALVALMVVSVGCGGKTTTAKVTGTGVTTGSAAVVTGATTATGTVTGMTTATGK